MKRKRLKLPTGCPRCGGSWVRRSGFVLCSACGHVSGSQHAEAPMVSQFGQRLRPGQAGLFGNHPTAPVDDEGPMPPDLPGRAHRELPS